MNSIQTMPASAVGKALTMTNGSSQDWKLTTIKQVDQHDRERDADEELLKGVGHRLDLPAHHDGRAGGSLACGVIQDLLDIGRDRAEVAVIVGRENVDDRLNGVVRHDGVADAALDRGDAAEDLFVRSLAKPECSPGLRANSPNIAASGRRSGRRRRSSG